MKTRFLTLIVAFSVTSFAYSLEFLTQEISVADGWQEIELSREYTDPVIVTGAITNNDPDSVIAEIGSVTPDSFQLRIRNWGTQQLHTADETVTVMVVERGETTYGGLTIVAGKQEYTSNTAFTSTGRSSLRSIDLPAPIIKQEGAQGDFNFSVFGQVINSGGHVPLNFRNSNVADNTDQFVFRFEKGERNNAAVNVKGIHYIVIQSGMSDDSVPLALESFVTERLYSNVLRTLALNADLEDPIALLGAPGIRGGDNTAIRYQDLVTGSVTLRTDEAPSYNEVHTTEEVSALVIAENPNYVAPAPWWSVVPWWSPQGRGVLSGNAENNFGAANLGQLKNFVVQATVYFEERGADLDDLVFPGGGLLTDAIDSWAVSDPANFGPLNIGQLKYHAEPFWRYLIDNDIPGVNGAGFRESDIPWTLDDVTDDNNFAVANLGQLKNVFSFNSIGNPGDRDADGILDSQDDYPDDFYNNEDHTVVVVSGNNQSYTAGGVGDDPIILQVLDSSGEILVNAPVTVNVPLATGRFSLSSDGGDAQVSWENLRTDENGEIRLWFVVPNLVKGD